MEINREVKYAGFWIRFVASFIDTLVLLLPLALIDAIFGDESIATIFLSLILWGIYISYFLSSDWRGTVGKRVLGLEVVDLNFEQLTLKEAIFRWLLSLISYTFIIPLFMMFFTDKKQTFHDYYANTLVIDKYKTESESVGHQVGGVRKFFTWAIAVFLLVIWIPLFPYIYFFISYSQSLDEQREYSYRTIYSLPDTNDTVIKAYNKKLIKITKMFIESDDVYVLFKSKVQEDIVKSCVEERYKVLGSEDYLRSARYFAINARNTQIKNNEEKIEAVKKHEKVYFNNHSMFDLKLIDGAIEQLEVDTKSYICEVDTPVKKLYNDFLMIYLSRNHFTKNEIYSNPWLKKIVNNEPDIWEVFLRRRPL